MEELLPPGDRISFGHGRKEGGMTIKTCKNCQHFNLYTESYMLGGRPGFGTCESEKFVDYSDEERQPPDDGLGYSDFEGHRANFCVGPLFGCIHFTRRTA